MSERLIIDQANIAESTMNAISNHIEAKELDFEELLDSIVIIQFKDGLIQAYLSYDEQDNQYIVETVELNTGDEIIQHEGETLHMIESNQYINQFK